MPLTEHEARVDGYPVPEPLQEMDVWTVWDLREKVPLAPWVTGDMYRAGWGEGVVKNPESRMEERPETDYGTARMYADIPPKELHRTHPFPRNDDGEPDLPDRIVPTMLLPHKPPEPPLMQVDFDDVRDADAGTITAEVADIINRLNAYTEISVSGEGLHCYIRAALPGALGKFIADLDTKGAIELYDHGRFTACTWQHMAGTPETIPERQAVVDDLVAEYETEVLRDRRKKEHRSTDRDIDDVLESMRSDDSRGNGYVGKLDLKDVAREGRYGTQYYHHVREDRNWHNGPHPAHGPEKSSIDDCTNFGINGDQWNCFAHEGGGGGALNLLAVVKGVLTCEEASRLSKNPRAMAKTCLYAREVEPSLADDNPPYKALVGVAQVHDLVMADADEGILGEDCWKIARVIYEEMEPADIEL